MSLLTSLVTQVAQSAIQSKMSQSKMGGQSQADMGGLGNIFGNVLGGGVQQPQMQSNGFGLDDIIGMAMNQNQGMSQGGVLGQVLGSVLGGGMGNNVGMNQFPQSQSGFGGKGMLMAALLPIALMFIQRNGGLSGAFNKIQNMGFGHQANSWMSADQSNQPLDPNDINQLFDNDELAQVAAQTGVDQSEVRQGMAELLPQLFDSLTPNGDTRTEPEANDEISQILSQLSQFKR
ncbi:MAG: YidB family protein [Moraxella osloensis]